MLPNLLLILGGAASGKSKFAEELILSSSLEPFYIATAAVWDDEMRQKISLHQARRGTEWALAEAQDDVSQALTSTTKTSAVLLDCATMWLTNQLMAGHDLDRSPQEFLRQIADAKGPLIVVSNEVGQGIVPDNAMSRQFREAQGRLNIAIAHKADAVVQIVAGLPNVLKGVLP